MCGKWAGRWLISVIFDTYARPQLKFGGQALVAAISERSRNSRNLSQQLFTDCCRMQDPPIGRTTLSTRNKLKRQQHCRQQDTCKMKQRHTSVSLRYNHLWLLWFSCILSFAVAVAASDITHQPSKLHWSAASSVPSDDGLAVEGDSEDKHTNNNDRLFSLLRKIERVSSSSHYRRSKIGRRHSSRYHGWVIVTRGGSGVGAEAEIEEAILPTNSSDVTNSSDLSSVETAPLSSLSSEWIDTHARSIALTMAWVVTAQTVSTVLHSFRDQVVEVCECFLLDQSPCFVFLQEHRYLTHRLLSTFFFSLPLDS